MRQYQQKHTHTQGAIVNWGTRSSKPTKKWKTTQTYLTNTSWIFRVQVIDCFMRFWGLSRLKFSMHFVFAACNWPTTSHTSLASDTVCLCNLPRTCWGPNIRIPTIMLRTWEKTQHSQKLSENRREFLPIEKKNKAVLSFSLGPYSNSHDRSEPRGPVTMKKSHPCLGNVKIQFYETEGTWRNIWRNNWKKMTAYPSFS